MQTINDAVQLKQKCLFSRLPVWTYISACMASAVLPLLFEIVWAYKGHIAGEPLYSSVLFASFGLFFLAVLTFPFGVLGVALWSTLIYLGLTTPTESLVLSALVFIPAGYFQWYRILPKLFQKRASLRQ